MTGHEIADIMEEIAPDALKCDWDNVGVMAGSLDTEVMGIMLCLDLTQAVLDEAISEGCNMIITHHPLIFHPVKTLAEDNVRGKLLSRVVREHMLVFSAHTNLDFAEGGVNDSLIKQLGVTTVHSDDSRHHRFGDLPRPMTLSDFADFADEALGAEGVRVVMPDNVLATDIVKRVGVSCGAFDGETDWIYEYGVDVLVTGEIKHNEAVDLEMEEFPTISAGHFPTEIWGVDSLAMRLGEMLQSASENPPEVFVSGTAANPLGKL